MRADVLEVCRSAVFLGQEIGASEELARGAAGTLGRVRAVVIGDVVVTDVAEPAHGQLAIKNIEKNGMAHQCTLFESAKRPIPSE